MNTIQKAYANPASGSTSGGVSHSGSVQHLCLIDGLRGLAALAVVMLHYNYFLYHFPGGQMDPQWRAIEPGYAGLSLFYYYGLYAVNLFWMISGFVFAHVYCGKAASTRDFIVNRLARLYPLHFITLLAMALLQTWAFTRLGYWLLYYYNDWQHFLLHLFLISDWGFDPHPAFNAPIWSVSAEVAVYGLFWILHRWLDRAGPLLAVLLTLLAGLALLTGTHNLIVACAYFFFAGSALALWLRRIAARLMVWSVASLALFVGGALLLWDNYALLAVGGQNLAISLGLIGVCGGMLLALAGLEPWASPGLRRACLWLGDASYGAYLWHVPLTLVVLIIVADSKQVIALAGHWWFLLLWIAVVLIVARSSLRWFEAPARRWIRSRFC